MKKRAKRLGVSGSIKYVGDHYEGRYLLNDWKIVLRCSGKQYTFSMTTGQLAGEPTIVEALNCLVLDASCYFNSDDFRDFCGEFGWEIDEDEAARKRARKAYNGCSKAYDNLVRVFGHRTVKSLMFETEQL